MNEEQLVKDCIEGIRLSQKQFYEIFARKMMAVCLRYADSIEEAEDLLQEGFIKVFENLKYYRFEGPVEAWVRRVIVTQATYKFKLKGDLKTFELTPEHQIEADESYNSDQSLHANDIVKMIQKLPAGFRTVFNLYAIEGFNHREIANMLGISEGTSKSQYARARAILLKYLNTSEITAPLEK